MTNGSSRHSLDERDVASLAARFNFFIIIATTRGIVCITYHSLKSSDEHHTIGPSYNRF